MKARPQTGRDGEKTSAKHKVFVSYAREDSSFVEKLTRDLVHDGFDVWLDRERIQGGDSIPAEIADAIKGADFFLVVVSGSSNKSPWVRSELNKAVTWQTDSGRPRTIPIRRGNAPIPAIVGDRHYVQFRQASYNDSYAELRSVLLEQPPPPATRLWRKVAVLAAAAALLLAGIGTWFFLKPPPGVPTIVVTSFTNTSGRPEDAWVSTALGDMLTAALRAGGGARIVDRAEVSKAERDFLLAGKQPSPADFRQRLGAAVVVSGSFKRSGPGSSLFKLSWTFNESSSRGAPKEGAPVASLKSLVGHMANLADQMRKLLSLDSLNTEQREQLQALFPKTPKGLELYFTGMETSRSFDLSTAYKQLDDVKTAEPDHPMIYWRLASVAWELRRDSEAQEFARRAQELARNLPPRERLEIDRIMPTMQDDWEGVAAKYEELVKLVPEEYSFRLELADAYVRANAPGKAGATLDALLAERPAPPLYIKAKAYLQRAELLDKAGQPGEAIDLLDLAVESAKAAAAAYLLAEAQLLRSQVLSRLGRQNSAASDLAAAQRTFARAGDEIYVNVCAEQRAILDFSRGVRPLSAILEDLQALEKIYRAEGTNEELARVLTLQSAVLSEQGRLAEADGKLKEAGAAVGEKNPDTLVAIRIEQAITFLLSRKTEEAEMIIEQVVAETDLGSLAKTATALPRLAEILYYRGRLEEAELLQAGVLEGGHAGNPDAYSLFRQGMILAARGDAEGRKKVEEAYALQEQGAESGSRAETALGLARLDNLAGDFGNAADLAKEAEAVLGQVGRPDLVALAQATRAWALTCEGDRVAAEKALEAAKGRSRTSEDFRVHFEPAIAAARFQALADHGGDEGIHDLERIIAEARQQGYRLYELDARLALGEVKLHLGMGGREELEQLRADASQAGFRHVQELAARMLENGPVCHGRPMSFRDRWNHWFGAGTSSTIGASRLTPLSGSIVGL